VRFILGLFQHLNLSDDDMSKRIDRLLLDFSGEYITDEVLDERSEERFLS
jgi:hypothetical protein